MTIAREKLKFNNVHSYGRFLAHVNLALGDSGVAAWEAKYRFLIARPITYIRQKGVDSSPEGSSDPQWTPLGAPATNGGADGRNLSPPFPAYPSGHAVFGGALFQMIREYYTENGVTDDGFEFLSDEYNGLNYTPGKEDVPRGSVKVKFNSLAEAEEENGQSRIWLGIHWKFDKEEGIDQGKRLSNFVYKNSLKVLPAP